MLEKFVNFLNRSPTTYHAAKEISEKLAEADFTPLKEDEKWELEPGKSYFIIRDNSLLAAFKLPKEIPATTTLLASHLDSPALKLKPKATHLIQGITQFGTESYGGPLLHTWLDRDLAIAGRIVVMNNAKECEVKTVYLDDYPLIIPSLAIHLDREGSEKGFVVHKQHHLQAVCNIEGTEKSLEELLKKHHSFQQLLSFDLFLVPIEKAHFNGFDSQLISSYRLDNLSSAFASLHALLEAQPCKGKIQMACFWDHEEIGSQTFSGADSLFMNELFERICLGLKMDREDYYRMKSRSLCLSLDVGHAFHPNFPDKNDPQNAPLLGKGPAIKYSMRYATNSSSAAPIVHLAQKHKIPLQTFAARSDIRAGGTVGSMMGANPGIPTVDLGVVCWAMHSIRETIAANDQVSLAHLLQKALEDHLITPEDL